MEWESQKTLETEFIITLPKRVDLEAKGEEIASERGVINSEL